MGLLPRPFRRVGALIPVVVAAGLAGCGGGGEADGGYGDGAMSSEGVEAVAIEHFLYAPDEVTIPAGTTIEFRNEDGSPHTATSTEAGAFDTGTIKPGASGELTLEEPGTFAYYCAFHPFMNGKITVE